MTGITWLHISDWHEGVEKERTDLYGGDKNTVFQALIKDINNRTKISSELKNIDFIVFSGDVAFSGTREQYESARTNFFEPILKETGCLRNQLFIVPGNHDLERKRLSKLPLELQTSVPDDPEDLQTWIRSWLEEDNRADRELLLNPFLNYRDFVSKYTGQPSPHYGSFQIINVRGIRVALLGLNSALMAARPTGDKGHLVVGIPQITEQLQRIENIEDYPLRIAVMHHPYKWLCQKEKEIIEPDLSNKFHFILRGHEHEGNAVAIASPTGDCRLISAGASFDRIEHPNNYNFVHLDFEQRQGRVYFRKWIKERKQWEEDTRPARRGVFEFDLPRNLRDNIEGLQKPVYITLNPRIKVHCENLSKKILSNQVVPFLGADINLCNRPFKEISDPWKWDIDDNYPPTNLELAAYLDREIAAEDNTPPSEYLRQVLCPLCAPERVPGDPPDLDRYPLGFPVECPINTQIVTRLHLQHVSQFWSKHSRVARLNQYLMPIYNNGGYGPNCVHEFLADLPSLITNYSHQTGSPLSSANYSHPLIVTVCFDSTLELAFRTREKPQPYDLVSYIGDKFIHQRFDPEEYNDQQVHDVGEIIDNDDPEPQWFEKRPVILRLCGPAKWDNFQYDQTSLITEDDFLNFLSNKNYIPDALRFLVDKINTQDDQEIASSDQEATITKEQFFQRLAKIKRQDNQEFACSDKGLTITEDQFLQYLAHNVADMLPVDIWMRLSQDNLWFLGYSLSYWNLRGIVRYIASDGYEKNHYSAKWWSFQEKPDSLDRELWMDIDLLQYGKKVEFYHSQHIGSLEQYIDEIESRIRELTR